MNLPLLTTYDGVGIFDCETAWVIRDLSREPEELKILDNVYGLYSNKGYIFFATKENAFKYWEENRPRYGKNQISMIAFAPYPIPVITPLGEAYVIYVSHSPVFENDEVTCALCEGGQWRTFSTADIKSHHNATYGITKNKTDETHQR
jgi:hypothetical protein